MTPFQRNLTNFRAAGHAVRESLHAGIVVLMIDSDHISTTLQASVIKGAIEWKLNEQTGQMFRQQSLFVHINLNRLPPWATEEALAQTGKIQFDSNWYKIGSAQKQDVTLRLTASRWPSDSD